MFTGIFVNRNSKFRYFIKSQKVMRVIKCRICSTNTREYSSLLANHHLFKHKLTLLDYMKKVTSVQLTITDEDSQSICASCIDKLHISFEFIENVRKAEHYLSLLNDSSAEDIKEIVVKQENDDVELPSCDVTFDDDHKHETESHVKLEHDTVKRELPNDEYSKPCTVCKKQIPDVIWNAHRFSHRGKDGKYACLNCEKQFNTYRSLKGHNDTVHDNKTSKAKPREKKKRKTWVPNRFCCVCNVEKGREEMKTHVLTHKNEQGTYDCPKCERKCPSYTILLLHIGKHPQNKRPVKTPRIRKCCICQVVKKFNEMNDHIASHRDEDGNYECPKCAKKWQSYSLLLAHVKGVHASSEYVCSHCGVVFSTLNVYNGHVKKHQAQHRVFKCEQCPRVFKEASQVLYHVQTRHTLEKTFVCHECGHKYWTKLKLNNHMKDYHSSDSHCKCEVCGKEFTNRASMKRHLINHSKPTKKCPHCSAMFHYTNKLRQHMCTHTGEKPLKCAYCDQSFIQYTSLKLHVSKHHPGEDYRKCLKNPVVDN